MSKGTLNKVQLIGRLGRDPELRFTANGQAVATLNLATNESYKDKDGSQVDLTDWHHVIAWRKLAEICGQYLKKGSLVYVEGKLKTRSYSDKQGQKRYVTEIVADVIQILGGQPQTADDQKEQRERAPPTAELPIPQPNDDGMPF